MERDCNFSSLISSYIKLSFRLTLFNEFIIPQLLLAESIRVLGRIPAVFKPLMSPHLAKVDAAIEPGLTMLNWTSLSLDAYIDSVYEALKELELLIDRANDLVKFRIEAVLKEMSKTTLCELPSDSPWTIEKFLKNTEVCFLLVVVVSA